MQEASTKSNVVVVEHHVDDEKSQVPVTLKEPELPAKLEMQGGSEPNQVNNEGPKLMEASVAEKQDQISDLVICAKSMVKLGVEPMFDLDLHKCVIPESIYGILRNLGDYGNEWLKATIEAVVPQGEQTRVWDPGGYFKLKVE